MWGGDGRGRGRGGLVASKSGMSGGRFRTVTVWTLLEDYVLLLCNDGVRSRNV